MGQRSCDEYRGPCQLRIVRVSSSSDDDPTSTNMVPTGTMVLPPTPEQTTLRITPHLIQSPRPLRISKKFQRPLK